MGTGWAGDEHDAREASLNSSIPDKHLRRYSLAFVDTLARHKSVGTFRLGECFGPRLAVWIEIGRLPNADRAVAKPLPEAFVVERGGVERRPVVPDGYVSVSSKT